ncbi:MAG: trypsin-like peptidase domain-containing protein [Planctomycetes bacterium]|nr:trypsin-like peptidase domain-containing protein [Planctomycetota bacterium]
MSPLSAFCKSVTSITCITLLLMLCNSGEASVEDAVVKIITISAAPDYYTPWSLRSSSSSTGSGVIISGNRIITNGHVIRNASFLQVKRNGQSRSYRARILHSAHDADLAIITVDDVSFFEGITPLELGSLPESQADVKVYGFPIGGNSLSVTKGVVSRIENVNYSHSGINLLGGQIDAAINPGNSGGPVLQDGKIVGIVMQGRRDADNIGYMVPAPVIDHVLRDLEDGSFDGFPGLGISTQSMENPALKEKYAMASDQSGRLVMRIIPGSNSAAALQAEDILLSIDGNIIADDGTITFRGFERTGFQHIITNHQIGDLLKLTVLRDKKVLKLEILLEDSLRDNRLVPLLDHLAKPRYYIYGGIIFMPLTGNLLARWGSQWRSRAPRHLVEYIYHNEPREDIDEVVIMLRILAADVNVGYHRHSNVVIDRVNGTQVRNMKELISAIENNSDTYTAFGNEKGSQIVLNHAQAQKEEAEILLLYKIDKKQSLEQ